MAEKKLEKVSYPRLVKAKNGRFEYQFKLGDTQILKVKDLLEANEFSEGYALVKVNDKWGNPVYKYLGLNGKLSEDSYYMAFDYCAGRALCQVHKDDKVQFRDFDGKLNPQQFDLEKTYSYKKGTQEEENAGLNIANKLNLYGFAVVSVKGQETIANMLGEYPNAELTKKEVINRGIQLYNFYNDKLNLEDLDKADLADPKFLDYVKRMVNYKHNLKMISKLNDGNIKEILSLMEAKSQDLRYLEQLKAETVEY